jgi:hypothetical protein
MSSLIGGPLFLTIITDQGYSTNTQVAFVQGPVSLLPSDIGITNTAVSIPINCSNCPLDPSEIASSGITGLGAGTLSCSSIINITMSSFVCVLDGQIDPKGGDILYQISTEEGKSNVVKLGSAIIGKVLKCYFTNYTDYKM